MMWARVYVPSASHATQRWAQRSADFTALFCNYLKTYTVKHLSSGCFYQCNKILKKMTYGSCQFKSL